MAKLTEQYDNEALKSLAKSQYEQKRRSKVPTEIIDLPSYGKVYSESSPLREGKIEMRYLTARDEDILTTPSFITEGIVFDKLLDEIIVSPVKSKDLIGPDRDALIIAARILCYGSDYEVTVKAPSGKMVERIVNLAKLKPLPFELRSNSQGEFEYETNAGVKLLFKFPTTEKTDKITELLASYIVAVDGERDRSKIIEYIEYDMLAFDSREFRNYIAKHRPGLNYEYEFEGENGGTFTAMFPITTKLFWS